MKKPSIDTSASTARHGIAVAFAAAAVTLSAFSMSSELQASGDATVIVLTQTPCQFLETEGVDHGYSAEKRADCMKINDASGAERLEKSENLVLKPGKYIFRVSNKNVPYTLGFWLRGDGLANRAMLPSVSGGGLAEGQTADYQITLEEGDYVFSCPLNPTPDYKLRVKG
ncbi:hypothetical protein [Denitrobaculum tricleocarpae]|uniref:Uncharacterized protein n=1 Tax=Denitrobaculum tricleocarpae TaxID=2591009 RepID=A0A545TF70_9PROT|nr:hypothetical protein [Denitrobaculum tricleocarpae]TQV75884.1 hypothetical protein FKG95_23555 [Denitrobaculum tricleocarpae]